MKEHLILMAEYNAWANERLYRIANQLTDEQYKRNVGAYFKSLHGTLNHLLVTDLIWMHRLDGAGDLPTALDAILFDELPALTAARQKEDERILHFAQELSDQQMEDICTFHTLKGTPLRQKCRELLANLFNHQTHHRGQAHTILTLLGIAEPEPLDLLMMQIERKRV